jgi:hypothetical protein
MMQLSTHLVERANIGRNWREVKHWVAAACEVTGGEVTPELVKVWLQEHATELVLLRLVSDNSLVGCMVLDHTDPTRLHIISLAGELPPGWHDDAWILLRRLAHEWGCTVVTCRGRKGWQRVLPSWGFEQASDGTMFRRV